jgi:hypothetical protein
LANFMRLSLMKAAHAGVGGAPRRKSGYLGRKRWAKPNDRSLQAPLIINCAKAPLVRFERTCCPFRTHPDSSHGHAHTYGVPELKVQLLMFWMAVNPPVPPVKPTYAVEAPTVEGILMAEEYVNIFPVTVSVRFSVRVVPL